MGAWWWILITAHLVWGSPERSKDDYKNTIDRETNDDTNRVTEDIVYPSFILDPKVLYTGSRRGSADSDNRENKQMGFRWRDVPSVDDDDDEEEESEDNSDIEENAVYYEPGDEDLMNDVYSYISSNTSRLETDNLGNHYREAFTKRKKPALAFSSWGGKRDPEMTNNVGLGKRSNFNSPIFQKNSVDSKLELSRRRYPFFSSWAGKRAAAFNSWGGKRDYSTEIRDISRAKRESPKAKIGFNSNSGNQVDLNNKHSQVYTSINHNALDSEDKFNFQHKDFNSNSDGTNFLGEIPEDKYNHSPEDRNFQPEFDNLKRAAAFNSWGGKRISDENLIMKKPASFNSWAGKRAAAFNSWGGKRAAAFNSWGGKRAAAFNSWGGKRAAAFNSWGGKRAAAFNSWGGKRAAAFNSWGGKRTAALNSWGGKRAAAFNSWGGKRTAAFNSWGGKRSYEKLNENTNIEYPIWTSNKYFFEEHFPVIKSHDTNVDTKTQEPLHQTDRPITSQEYIFKHATDNNLDKTKVHMLFNHKKFTNVHGDELNNHERINIPTTFELLGHKAILEKRTRPSFTSWAGKRSPLFSSWYSNQTPTVLLTSGKRRPAFSSWGGKRSEHKLIQQLDCSPRNTGDKDATLQQPEVDQSEELSPSEKNAYLRKRREVESSDEKTPSVLTTERHKRSIRDLMYLKSRVFTRMILSKERPHRKDYFFAWGGKRAFDEPTTLQ